MNVCSQCGTESQEHTCPQCGSRIRVREKQHKKQNGHKPPRLKGKNRQVKHYRSVDELDDDEIF